MERKEFCLKWNNYLDVFHGAFSSLLNSEHFTDVTLSCDSQSIKCHRLVLSSCSSYFETLLLGISHPHPIIILKDVKFHDLLALVTFLYIGEVTVSQAQASSLMKVAEMLKVKGLAYPDETVNQIQKPDYHSQNSQMNQPASEGNRIDSTSKNSFMAEDSSSNLEPPVVDTSNNKLVNYPAETSSSVHKTDIAVCNSLHVKDEVVVGFDKGGNNSSSQFEDDGKHFDSGSDKLIGNQILERTERKPDTSLDFSEVEDALPSHNEEVFGVPNLFLFPKREHIALGNFPQFSGPCKLQPDAQESGAMSFDSQEVANTSSSNTNGLMEASNSDIGLHEKKFRKDYECNICHKRFPFHSNLESHQRVHIGGKPYKCDFCKKFYTRSSTLKLHQRVHTGEKPFMCGICRKSFTQMGILKEHQRLHTGDKPFKCNLCKKCFTQSNHLNNHQRSHTGEKPFKCDFCKKCFTRSSSLNLHQRVHTL